MPYSKWIYALHSGYGSLNMWLIILNEHHYNLKKPGVITGLSTTSILDKM